MSLSSCSMLIDSSIGRRVTLVHSGVGTNTGSVFDSEAYVAVDIGEAVDLSAGICLVLSFLCSEVYCCRWRTMMLTGGALSWLY